MMSEDQSRPQKLSKKRPKLPTSPPSSGDREGKQEKEREHANLMNAEELMRLSPEVLQQLQEVETSTKFMPGKVASYTVIWLVIDIVNFIVYVGGGFGWF